MDWWLLRRSVLLLILMLSPIVLFVLHFIIPGSRGELFAPELGKNYALTENMTLTSLDITLPRLFQPRREVPFVMTHEKYLYIQRLIDPDPLPKLGKVLKESRVQVGYLFNYKDFNGSTRYGKLQFTDPTTGERLTVYSYWEDVELVLKEVQ